MNATQHNVLAWLGDSPCVLLIDEINKVTDTSNAGLNKFPSDLIFSSHIVTNLR